MFFGGKRTARRESAGAVYYYFSDHLGSADVVTDSAGVIKEESDYYPYGGERVLTDLLPKQNYKFTGKERDTESGLDYFGARYYGSRMGRWMSPDEYSGGPIQFDSKSSKAREPLPYAQISLPQSLNKYSYVWNNALVYVDPNGHETLKPCEWSPCKEPPSASASLEDVHTTLDVAGIADPSGVADGVNAGIYLLEGRIKDAAISGVSLLPLGDFAKAGRMLSRLSRMPAKSIRAFKSFDAFKAVMGTAGKGNVWHHIVEQSKLKQFGAEAIHNTANVRAVPREINQKIANFYSSKPRFAEGMTVRKWLEGQSFEAQYKFGEDVLNKALSGELK
ncbi:MAG: RHS repeat-associated core domain-containing protein [Acidobacteriales bacterium]|nr:RHS repeat-associated core domain-containing protein [Terriglobales bacterium]